MALMVGLMLLLVLTLLGIAAIRGTTTEERMSANSQQHVTTFQATEAAIRQVMAEARGDGADGPEHILITARKNGISPKAEDIPKRTPESGHGITAKAGVVYTGMAARPNSSLGEGVGMVDLQFTIDATGKQAVTNASAHHQQGVSRPGPK
ncbi:MAG: PilX N-terminal domain-containing pilus assembly protein [Stenotrophobium sp.]